MGRGIRGQRLDNRTSQFLNSVAYDLAKLRLKPTRHDLASVKRHGIL